MFLRSSKIMMFIAFTYIISYNFFSGTLEIILLRCTLRCLISIHVEINETTNICFSMNEINESYGEEYNTTQYNGEENNFGSFVEWDAKIKNIFLWKIVAQILGTVNVYFETLILFSFCEEYECMNRVEYKSSLVGTEFCVLFFCRLGGCR